MEVPTRACCTSTSTRRVDTALTETCRLQPWRLGFELAASSTSIGSRQNSFACRSTTSYLWAPRTDTASTAVTRFGRVPVFCRSPPCFDVLVRERAVSVFRLSPPRHRHRTPTFVPAERGRLRCSRSSVLHIACRARRSAHRTGPKRLPRP